MSKGDDKVNKSGPRVKVGGRLPAQARNEYLFGSEGEIEDRDPNKSMFNMYGLPNTQPPAFSQIKPEASTGRNVNRGTPTHKSGEFKFSGGVGKP